MRNCTVVVVLAFLIVGLNFALNAAQDNLMLMIDSRLLVIAHPLFSSFDPDTSRFKGTSSEFVMGGQPGLDALYDEIRRNEEWLAKGSEVLRERLQQAPVPERMAIERDFLRERQELEQQTLKMKIRAFNARLVPGRPGITPASAIYPQLNEINSAIREVISKLKQKYKIEVVVDVIDLLPVRTKSVATPRELTRNVHRDFLKTGEFDRSTIAWFENCADYWADDLGMDASVIPVGAKDVRLEALKLFEEITRGAIE